MALDRSPRGKTKCVNIWDCVLRTEGRCAQLRFLNAAHLHLQRKRIRGAMLRPGCQGHAFGPPVWEENSDAWCGVRPQATHVPLVWFANNVWLPLVGSVSHDLCGRRARRAVVAAACGDGGRSALHRAPPSSGQLLTPESDSSGEIVPEESAWEQIGLVCGRNR